MCLQKGPFLYPTIHKVHLMCRHAFACPRMGWGHQRVLASKLRDRNLLLSDSTALHPQRKWGWPLFWTPHPTSNRFPQWHFYLCASAMAVFSVFTTNWYFLRHMRITLSWNFDLYATQETNPNDSGDPLTLPLMRLWVKWEKLFSVVIRGRYLFNLCKHKLASFTQMVNSYCNYEPFNMLTFLLLITLHFDLFRCISILVYLCTCIVCAFGQRLVTE